MDATQKETLDSLRKAQKEMLALVPNLKKAIATNSNLLNIAIARGGSRAAEIKQKHDRAFKLLDEGKVQEAVDIITELEKDHVVKDSK